VAALHAMGVRPVVMLTGDNAEVGQAIGRLVGADEVRAGLMPERKIEEVRALAARHGNVAMVGDGVNDAPALAAADIGLAVGGGADAALETAGAALMRGDVSQVADAVELARAARARVRENLFWASVFNLAGLPLAALGLLNPMIAGAAMAFSSLAVALNSMRLSGWKPGERR
jgi:Cu+-exporting ATPase